jgi:two-component sensor histidine kinase
LFKESQNRVYSMALIHEKLYETESLAKIDLAEYIRGLTTNLFLSYGVSERVVRPKICVENIELDIDTVIPCALIINELVSNSLKHAFRGLHGDRTGEICIGLRRVSEGQASPVTDRLELTVRDNGAGLSDGFSIQNSESLGLKLVSILAKQLRAAIDVSATRGTEFRITFDVKNQVRVNS